MYLDTLSTQVDIWKSLLDGLPLWVVKFFESERTIN